MARRVRDTHRKAIYATVLWVTASLAFAVSLLSRFHTEGSLQYLAGYAIEEALSVDNLFVFLLLFRTFQIPEDRQPKVLFWGVTGAVVMRGTFIAAGVGLLRHFHWITYVFGALLLIAAIRLVIPSHEKENAPPRWIAWLRSISPVSERQDAFFVHENGRRMITILMLALIAVELTDVVFAMDSIPAVLSITQDPFLAYTSNIMAVMGLRSLYVLLAAMLERLRFLHFGLAAVLAFAAGKMLVSAWIEVGPLVSLAVIAALLGTTIVLSVAYPLRPPSDKPQTA
jgi:tellurite resistance protein TerC